MRAIPRSELVWVQIPNGATPGASYPFPDQPTLNGVYICGLEVFDENNLTSTPDLIAVIPSVIDFSLTLNEGSDARYREMPCASLNMLFNSGIWKELLPVRLDWQKSRVHYLGAAATDAPYTFPVTFYYFRPEDIKLYGIEIGNSW